MREGPPSMPSSRVLARHGKRGRFVLACFVGGAEGEPHEHNAQFLKGQLPRRGGGRPEGGGWRCCHRPLPKASTGTLAPPSGPVRDWFTCHMDSRSGAACADWRLLLLLVVSSAGLSERQDLSGAEIRGRRGDLSCERGPRGGCFGRGLRPCPVQGRWRSTGSRTGGGSTQRPGEAPTWRSPMDAATAACSANSVSVATPEAARRGNRKSRPSPARRRSQAHAPWSLRSGCFTPTTPPLRDDAKAANPPQEGGGAELLSIDSPLALGAPSLLDEPRRRRSAAEPLRSRAFPALCDVSAPLPPSLFAYVR